MSLLQRVLACVFLSMAATPLWAAPGIVTLDFGGNTTDVPRQLALDPADNLYVNLTACGMFALDTDGKLSSTFGAGGRLVLTHCAKALSVEPDGSFFALEQDPRPRLQLRNASGAEVSVSSDLIPASPLKAFAAAASLARQSNGQFVIAGTANTGCNNCFVGQLGRFTVTGSPDTTFAPPFLEGLGDSELRLVRVLSTGKILALGGNQGIFAPRVRMLLRFNADGTTDSTFGTNGKVQLPDGPAAFAVDSTGRIYVPATKGTLVRIGSDGTLDGGYAGGTPTADVTITGLELDSAGRSVLFGSRGSGVNGVAYVTRFDSAGAFDSTFDGDGHAEIGLGNNLATEPEPCVGTLQSADRPVLACAVSVNSDTNVAVVRLTASGALDATFGVRQEDSDTYPDPFTFPDVTAPYGSARVLSAAIVLAGINSPTSIFGGFADLETAFSIGCNGTFARQGMIGPGQSICVRQPASAQPGGTAQATLNIGGRIGTFTVISSNSPADATPDAFAFADVTGRPLGVVVESAPVKILGIGGFATVSVENGEYSLECNPAGYRSTPTSNAVNGMNICVRHTTSQAPGSDTLTRLTVGGVSDTFTSTTVPADTTPEPFTFVDQTGVTPGSTVVSAAATISGIEAAAPVSVTAGEFSVGCNGTFGTSAATIQNGQTVCVRHVASAQSSTAMSTTLTVGGVSDTFTSTTMPPAASGGGTNSSGGGGAMDRLTIAMLLAFGVLFRCLPRQRRRRNQNRLVSESERLSTV